MFNDESNMANEGSTEEQAAQEPTAEEQFGPHIILFMDDQGEVQIATRGGRLHPKEMSLMFDVARSKLELLQFHMMMEQVAAKQRAEANPIVIARRDFGGLDL